MSLQLQQILTQNQVIWLFNYHALSCSLRAGFARKRCLTFLAFRFGARASIKSRVSPNDERLAGYHSTTWERNQRLTRFLLCGEEGVFLKENTYI